MAVAKVMTVHLLCQQRPSSAGCNGICSTPCRLVSNSGVICSSFGDATNRRIETLRPRGLSAAKNGLAVRTTCSASLEASTSISKEVEFTWKGPGTEVLLTGDFLNWEKKLALEKKSNDVFSLKQKLASGRYSYKFVVDGEWKHSPDSPTVPDGIGGFNNEVIVADQSATTEYQDSENATPAKVPPPTNTVNDSAMKKPANQSGSGVAAGNQGASAKPSPRAAPKKVVPESLKETMAKSVIPLLRNALGKEREITDLDITFEDNQLKTSFTKEDIRYCFWVFFPDGVLEGSRGSSLTSHGSPPSTIEPFLVDEKKVSAELLVFWIKKRLYAQRILTTN